jgi:RNA polymerase sigma-70 factor (ECF subfamily)
MNPSILLLEQCRKDDRKAHYDLYRLCFPFLVSVCRRYYVNTDDVQSAINFIFLKMVRNMSSYLRKSETVPFDLWTRRIAINHIIDEFRKNARYKENLELRDLGEEEYLHPSSDPLSEKDKLEEILLAIDQLSFMSRTVFNLFVIDGYGHDEIGKMLKISSGTSKAHLHNARKKLQAFLENEWKKKVVINKSVLQ